VLLEKNPHKNPLNANEPKRSTSLKKINKFLKKFDKYNDDNYIVDVERIFNEYYSMETSSIFSYIKRYIEHEKKIEMLSVILHNYGKDVYSAVSKHL
jgi:vacuolar-type H+-ATPase catalytic subunit A/Vma1